MFLQEGKENKIDRREVQEFVGAAGGFWWGLRRRVLPRIPEGRCVPGGKVSTPISSLGALSVLIDCWRQSLLKPRFHGAGRSWFVEEEGSGRF